MSEDSLIKVSSREKTGNDPDRHIFDFLFAALANKAIPIRSWVREQLDTFPPQSQKVIGGIAFRENFLSPRQGPIFLKTVPISRFENPPAFFSGLLIEQIDSNVKLWRLGSQHFFSRNTTT